MEPLESQDLIVIVVEDDLENVNNLSLPLETIKEEPHDQSLLFENIKVEKNYPFDVSVKIENVENGFSDNEGNKNVDEAFFLTEPSESNINLYSNIDYLLRKEIQDNIKVKTEPSILTNQEALADTQTYSYVEHVLGSEQEIEYLEEEYNEDCIPENNKDYISGKHTVLSSEKNVRIRKKRHSPIVSNSYIKDLQLQFPELKQDEELFVEVLAVIMKEIKAPPLPEKYYEQNYNEFSCIICGATTHTLPAAERHYLEKHGSRYLVCYACGDTFRSRTNLYKHEKRCKAEDIDIVLKARAIFLGGKGQNRPFLDLYKRKVQGIGKIESQQYLCTLCPAVYLSKQGLESHMNKHLGIRPYRCDKCSNAYTSLRPFQRHYEKHENTQYICHTCNRSFRLKEVLVVHMDTHLPTKKYGCPECDRRYAKKYALDIHVNKVHRKLPYPFACQICFKRYPRLSKLKEHMKKEHGLDIMSRNMLLKKLPTLSDEDFLNAKIVKMSHHILVNQDPVILED